ncbi:MAG: hypothetical protein AAB596_01625 [Patescibacteria group bacterium]
MTIIQPNKNKNKINFVISFLMLVLIASVAWGIFIYNQSVNFRHEISKMESNIRNLETKNAEFKNTLYQMTDLKNLESFKNNQSLVLDEHPEYIRAINKQLTISN